MDDSIRTSAPTSRTLAGGPFPSLTDLLALLGIYVVVQLAVSLILMLVLLFSGQGLDDLEPPVRARMLAIANLVCMSVLTLLFYGYRRWRGRPVVRVGCSLRRVNLPLVGWALLFMFALTVLIGPLLDLLPAPQQNVGRGWWALLALVVVAPLFEEWICRGFLFGSLRERFGLWSSCLLSALFFAIMHLQPASVLNAFFMGLVLAYLYACTGSIWSPILLHAVNNLCAYLLLIAGHGEDSLYVLLGERAWLYAACYGAAAAAALFAVIGFRRTRKMQAAATAAPTETADETLTPTDC